MPETTETVTDPTATETTHAPAATETTATDVEALAAEVAKWKQMAQKSERRAKENFVELEKLQQQHLSESEKAIQAARAEGRTEALRAAGARLVAAEVRVAAAGRGVNVDALLEGVDVTKFIDDDGEPKSADIAAWIDRVAPAPETGTTVQTVDLGQGARGGSAQGLGNDDPILRALERAVRR